MELKNIAVLGPRGNVGAAVVKDLLKHTPRFNVFAITRPTSTYQPPTDAAVTVRTADFSNSTSLTTALEGVDAAVCCVSGAAMQPEPMKLIIDAGAAAGVKVFVADEFVGNIYSKQFGRMPEAVTGGKRSIRKYLEELGEKGGMKWVSVNGGPFFDMWLMKGPAGFDISNRRARIYGSGNVPVYWTPIPTIASTITNIMLDPTPHLNKPLHIASVRDATQNTILAALEKVLNTKFSVEHVDIAKINNNALIALERGEIGKAMKGLTVGGQFYEEVEGEGSGGKALWDVQENDRAGVEMVSVEEAVKEALQNWGESTPVVESFFLVEPCEV